jgi:acyl-CoA synthetase (NDP forming)
MKGMAASTQKTDFERIFHPRRLAIAGVSAQGTGFGAGILVALLEIGFSGEIFPVNPRGGEIFGMKIHPRIEDIPGPIDMAILAVAAHHVPEALAACRKQGAAGAVILSAGFRELGTPEGIALEEAVKAEAAEGIRVIGPNCFGIYCPQSGLTIPPGPDFSRKSGPVAFMSQSGGLAADFALMGMWLGFGFSKMISFGNGADLRETDLLEYFAEDPETKIIALYMEGIADGDRFFRALKAAAARKPVIIYKGGLSEAGNRAVASHTASMGGSRIIWESLIRQAGAVQVHDFEELCHTCLAFAYLPVRHYRGMTVLGGGGAQGVAACDVAEANGMFLPPLEGPIYEAVYEALPKPGSSAANPVDVANPHVPPQTLKTVLLEAAKDERVDIQIQVSLFYHFKSLIKRLRLDALEAAMPLDEYGEAAREAWAKTDKPVVVVLPNRRQGIDDLDVETLIRKARQEFIQRGVPVFPTLQDALRAIRHVSDYHRRRENK